MGYGNAKQKDVAGAREGGVLGDEVGEIMADKSCKAPRTWGPT